MKIWRHTRSSPSRSDNNRTAQKRETPLATVGNQRGFCGACLAVEANRRHHSNLWKASAAAGFPIQSGHSNWSRPADLMEIEPGAWQAVNLGRSCTNEAARTILLPGTLKENPSGELPKFCHPRRCRLPSGKGPYDVGNFLGGERL